MVKKILSTLSYLQSLVKYERPNLEEIERFFNYLERPEKNLQGKAQDNRTSDCGHIQESRLDFYLAHW